MIGAIITVTVAATFILGILAWCVISEFAELADTEMHVQQDYAPWMYNDEYDYGHDVKTSNNEEQ